jgi:hypothetical protein
MSRYTTQLLEARTRLTRWVSLMTPSDLADLLINYDEALPICRPTPLATH